MQTQTRRGIDPAYALAESEERVLVFDLETVVDARVASRLTGSASSDLREQASALAAHRLERTHGASDFAPAMYHRVVAIGLVEATIQRRPTGAEAYIVESAAALSWRTHSEAAMLATFLRALHPRPRLVSFNGRGFDVPVVLWRCLRNGLDASPLCRPGRLRNDGYLRYGTRHIDLCDISPGSNRVTLDEVCGLLNLPGKLDPAAAEGAVCGDDVLALYVARRSSDVERYVLRDALHTMALFVARARLYGDADGVATARSFASLARKIGEVGEATPHLAALDIVAWAERAARHFDPSMADTPPQSREPEPQLSASSVPAV